MRDMMKPAILIIENDEDTRRLYADLLTYTDAKIVEAGNPYEAFEQLRRNPISLIVTDLHMPGGGLSHPSPPEGADLPYHCDHRSWRRYRPRGGHRRRCYPLSGKTDQN